MKTIIALFFFGVVTYAYTPKPLPVVDSCKQLPPKSNFQSSKFFSGTWFVTQAKDISTSVCHKFDASLQGSAITVTADGYYDIGRTRDFYKVPCTGTDTNKNGKFSITCQPRKPSSTSSNNIIVTVEVTVLETDNNKYAVVYRCATSGTVKTENYLVLQRNENEEISELKTILKKKDWATKLISRKESKNVCGRMPSA